VHDEAPLALDQDRHRDRPEAPIGLEGLGFVELEDAVELLAGHARLVEELQVSAEQAQAVLDGLARRPERSRRLAHRHLRYEVDEDLVLEGWLAQAVVEPKALRGEAPAAGAALEALDDAAVAAAREEAAAAPGERRHRGRTRDSRTSDSAAAGRSWSGSGRVPE
jgi:hypothetical protein